MSVRWISSSDRHFGFPVLWFPAPVLQLEVGVAVLDGAKFYPMRENLTCGHSQFLLQIIGRPEVKWLEIQDGKRKFYLIVSR